MDTQKPTLTVVTAAPVASAMTVTTQKSDPKDLPEPVKKLSKEERPIWKHVVESLAEYGLVHRTDALTLHVIVSTFARWAAAEKQLQELLDGAGTYFVKTPNGYEQPHQMYYVARDLKKELLRWLPEACLTIASFQKATSGSKDDGRQGDMFGDPLAQHVASKPRLVHSQ